MQKPAFFEENWFIGFDDFERFSMLLIQNSASNKSVIMYEVNFGLIFKRGAKLRAKARITFFDTMRRTGMTRKLNIFGPEYSTRKFSNLS